MLIHGLHATSHSWDSLSTHKRSLQPVRPSSFTLLGWFRLAPIDQYSWPIFLTAASRRSLDRVSVPMWGTFLSEPLSIDGLVGRYPANCLMERIPIVYRLAPLPYLTCDWYGTSGINLSFERLSQCKRKVGYALLTRAPVAIKASKLTPWCPATCMC